MMKYFSIIILSVNFTLAQDSNKDTRESNMKNAEIKSGSFSKSNFINNSSGIYSNNPANMKKERMENFEFRIYNSNGNRKQSFDIISSVGNNISFGGFWEKYAVINFTPQLDIKPAGFISIHANHYLNCLIPADEIKDYSQTIILQSIAVLAVDNSMKIFFNSNVNWIAEVISFAAKNLLLNVLIKPAISNSADSPSPVLHYENYYYSMSIAF